MSASFYRVRSDRTESPYADGEPPLRRESFACRERPDLTLFLWREEAGQARRVQLLFGESFLEWIADRGWVAGVTNRAGEVPGAPGRGKGVRTLRGHAADRTDPVLRAGLELLAGATVPAELVELRARLVEEAAVGNGREH